MPKNFLVINKTIKSQFDNVIAYHLQVPSFGDWGFNLAFNGNNNITDISVETKYLNSENINSMFVFGEDEKIKLEDVEANNMFKPSLITYYNEEVQNW